MKPKQAKSAHEIVTLAREQVESCALGQQGEAAAADFPEVPGYRVIREIHRGGQGVVYEAIQAFPSRHVAIKVLRHGLASSAAERTRLRREADVLARLQHPRIVSIHEAGVIGGNPYLVMDYIRGESLDRFAQRSSLSVDQSVELFLKICDAVGAAHRTGILHRDLKPSNIQVDEAGEPHVLDFGLAADADRAPVDRSATITGQFLGSLPWASPEQAAGDTRNIDMRTDIYALGLVLFHMLTRAFPYEAVGMPARVTETIQHTDPAKASTIRADVPADLDLIILKCLSKEQDRRYQSVVELTADLRRFQNHQPIAARSDSTWYVLTKTIRRHRRTAIAASFIAVLTLIYATTMTVFWRQAVGARADAQAFARERDEQFENAKVTYLQVIDQIEKWERSSGTAAIRRGMTPVVYEGLRKLLAVRPTDISALAGYARALCKLGDFAAELTRFDGAVLHYREAISIREGLAQQQPGDLELRAELSVALVRVGDFLGELKDSDGRRAHHERALTMDRELVEMQPENAHFWDNLSWSYGRLAISARDEHRPEDAASLEAQQLEAAQRAVELDPDNPVRLNTLLEAQLWQMPSLVYGASLRDAEIRLEAAKSRLRFDPENAAYARGLGDAVKRVDAVRANSRAGLPHLRTIVQTAERIVELSPDNPQYRRRLIFALRDLAYHAEQAGEADEADESMARAIEGAKRIAKEDPGVADYGELLALLRTWVMEQAARRQDFATANTEAAAAVALLTRVLADAPESGSLAHQLFLAQFGHAVYLSMEGGQDDGREELVAAMDLAEQSFAAERMPPDFLMDFAVVLTQVESDDFRDIDRGLELMRQAIALSRPDDVLLWERLANAAASAGRSEIACEVLLTH